MTRPLFKNKVYDGVNSVGGNSYITVATTEDMFTAFYSSEDASDVYTKLNLKVSVKGSVPFFSAGFKSQFSTDKTLKQNSLFYNSISSTINKIHTLNSQYVADMNTIIDSSTLAAINDNQRTPEYLFDKFGTHIIISNGVGGAINISGVYNSETQITNTELSAAINASSIFVSGNASGSGSEKTSEIQSSTSITVKATGGKTGLITRNPNFKDNKLWTSVDEWSKTVSENPTLSIIYKIVAIWDLATDPIRGEQIEASFYSRANEISGEISGFFMKEGVSPIIEHGGVYVIRNLDSRKAIQGDTTEARVLMYGTERNEKDVDACKSLHGIYSGPQQFVTANGTQIGPATCNIRSGVNDVSLQPINNSLNQRWVAVQTWNQPGTFYFKNVHLDRYLYAKNLKDNLSMATEDFSSNNLKFKVARVNDGGKESAILRSALNDTYKVSVKAGKANTNGAPLYLETGSETRTQWILEKVDQVDPSTLNKKRANL